MKLLTCFIPLMLLLTTTTYARISSQKEIPFQLLPSGHILLKAKIDGVEGSFIFDTGAGITVCTKTFFSKLQHTTQEDGGYTAFRATGERLDVNLFQVINFEMGAFKKAKEEISYLDVDLGAIDGIISLKALESQPFTIDFEKKVIRLESIQTLSGIKNTAKSMPIQLEQSRDKSLTIFSYFKVNDTLTLQISLDSGAGKDVFRLNSKYLTPLKVDPSDTLHVKKMEKRSEMNSAFVSNIYITKLKKLASDQTPAIHITDFPAQFVDGLIYDGIIWINWFGSKITFDLQHKMLLVQG